MAIMDISRRYVIGGTAAGVAIRSGLLRAQATKPIQIGLIQTLSGPQADVGKPHLMGAQLAIKEINESGGIGGRTFELVVRDTRYDPNAAITALHELAGNGINLIHGEAFSALVFASLPLLTGLNLVNISPTVTGMDATHDKFTRNFFRCTTNGHMQHGAAAVLAAKVAPTAVRWGGIVTDSLGFRLAWDSFTSGLKTAFPKFANHDVVLNEPVLVKTGTTNFRDAISRLVSQNLDGIQISMSGGEEVTMLSQAQAFALFRNTKISLEQSMITLIGPTLKSATPPRLWGLCLWHYDGFKNVPMAQRFYKNVVAETKQADVNPFAALAHTTIMSFAGAIRSAHSSKTEDVIAALETITFESVFGPLKYRKEDHQLLANQGFLHIEPQEVEPGYRVVEFVAAPWQDLIEPPSPGVKYEE